MTGILLNTETGDLMVKAGTLVIGDNMAQTAECVLLANPGEIKEYPLIGAGVIGLKNGTPGAMWCADTKKMLNACGVPVSKVSVVDGEIRLE